MQRTALVIKTYGDVDMSRAIVNGMESRELNRLRAESEFHKHKDTKKYKKMIAEAQRKYAVKPPNRLQQWFWGNIGLIALLLDERRTATRRAF